MISMATMGCVFCIYGTLTLERKMSYGKHVCAQFLDLPKSLRTTIDSMKKQNGWTHCSNTEAKVRKKYIA